jgi:hypothetical protein
MAERPAARPGQAHQQEAVARLQLAPEAAGQPGTAQARGQGDRDGADEGPATPRRCRPAQRPAAPASAARTAPPCGRPGRRQRQQAGHACRIRRRSPRPGTASRPRAPALALGMKTMTWSPGWITVSWCAMMTCGGVAALVAQRRPSWSRGARPRTMAPICAPRGRPTSSMRRPAMRLVAVAAHHGLQRLGGAAAQAVHGLHVAAPHVGQQLADHGVRRRHRDVDLVPCTRSA